MTLKVQTARKSLSNNLLHIIGDDRSFPVPRRELQRLASRMYRMEHLPPEQRISVIFCSNQTIKRLNSRYRKNNKPTDVLSFTFADPDLLGEIYISLPQASRQAREYGASLTDEILRLFIHGVFHLLGFDHGTVRQRIAMEQKESVYLLR